MILREKDDYYIIEEEYPREFDIEDENDVYVGGEEGVTINFT